MSDKRAIVLVFVSGLLFGLFCYKSCDMIDKRISIELKSPK